ncbi:DUF58 domain-containing protein [Alloalcanivorax mobilis]|uniref:DUF58 domain-containing protein n=1 Tax=Alloalcanivorax mobilis TaxID=2019569 RepID=UPI001E5B419C|nr:DUF58 domain-containing protein [Alloalcanivorax mobilis]
MAIRPGRRLIQCLLAWAALGALPLVARAWLPELTLAALLAWLGAGLAGALWALNDARRLRARPMPIAERRLPAALSVGVAESVVLHLHGQGRDEHWLVADHHPADDPHTGLPVRVALAAGKPVTEVRYPYRPTRRGRVAFGDIELWRPSPGRLWEGRCQVPAARQVPVYPDFSPIARAALAVDKSTARFGLRVQPRSGEGLEFHELRDYQSGDSPRRIDWKASARRQRLISRHFQDEQNQTLWILLDGGRRMGLPIGELTAFDHGLNAALLLAWSALRLGDRSGAMLFSAEPPRWIDPVRGASGIHQLLKGFFDVHPGDHASDFSQAARYFHRRWPRRSLVVIVSRLQPEDSDDLLAAVRLLAQRHLVMIADLQLPEQESARHAPVRQFEDAIAVAADAWEQQHRRDLQLRLRHAGAHLVAATPEHLSERLGQAYHDLKSSGRL